nr:metalloregulator ArsR/SmtB family transcription factor [Pseudomethylobacillus aquaticus]
MSATTTEPSMLDYSAMHANASQASQFLKALANPQRLLLLCQLSQGERCVSELEQHTGIRQPTLSQQLTVLRKELLVDTRRDGKQVYYRIVRPEALQIMQLLYTQFCQSNKES